jgi:non-homologous end joining protein Ku
MHSHRTSATSRNDGGDRERTFHLAREALSGRFDARAYHDEYQARVHELIEAKRAGKKVKRPRVRRPRSQGSLTDVLQSSLKQASVRKRT